jgi:hypothetical protein
LERVALLLKELIVASGKIRLLGLLLGCTGGKLGLRAL